MAEKPLVNLILLTYNSVSKLGQFFNKVLKSIDNLSYDNIEITVVDNNSRDNTLKIVKNFSNNSKKKVRIVGLKNNEGWSRGNNIGIFLALRSDSNVKYLLLVNDDLILSKNTVSTLVNLLENSGDVGIAQPVILNRDGTYNLGFQLSLGLHPSPIVLNDLKYLSIKEINNIKIVNIDYAIGAALMVRASLVKSIGFLDESYFYWFEDVDFSLRAKDAGYNVVCVLDAYAYHVGSATLGAHNPRIFYFLNRNHIWLIIKVLPYIELLKRLPIAVGESIFATILHGLVRKNKNIVKYSINGLRDAITKLNYALLSGTHHKRLSKITLGKLSPRTTARILKIL